MILIILAMILLLLFGVLAVFFTLNFIEYLYKDDERITKQSKFAALVCFAIALVAFVGFIYLLFVIDLI